MLKKRNILSGEVMFFAGQ